MPFQDTQPSTIPRHPLKKKIITPEWLVLRHHTHSTRIQIQASIFANSGFWEHYLIFYTSVFSLQNRDNNSIYLIRSLGRD